MRTLLLGPALGCGLYALVARRPPAPRPPRREDGGLVATVLVSAVVEELLWRGVVLRTLARHGRRRALAVTTGAFAAAHLPHASGRDLVVHAGVGGVLGLTTLRGHLATAAIAHGAYNALALLEEPP